MTPDQLESLARRVETEDPSEELRALVLAAFGSEAEPGSAPDPMVSIDFTDRFRPGGWRLYSVIWSAWSRRFGATLARPPMDVGQPVNMIVTAAAPTEPRARTAAALRARAVDAREAGK